MNDYKIVGKSIIKKTAQDLINESLVQENSVQKQVVEILTQKIGKAPEQKIQNHPEEMESCKIYSNLDNYFKEYIKYRIQFDRISNASIKKYNSSMTYLRYFIDENTVFNFRFFKDIQKKLQQLPKNFSKYKKYYEKSFDELLELKNEDDYQTLDNKTINGHLNNYKLFFGYLKYEEILEQNPANNIKSLPESTGTIKEEYTNEELKKIFKSDIDINYLNMCKVALYCGLRIEEVLSIKQKDVKDNLIYIDLEDTSSKKHQRIIPIHKNLTPIIEKQIKQNNAEYLFFNGNVGNEVGNVGKRLNRRLKTIVPIKEKTFHSFRKNFSQELELNTNSEEKIKQYLMGHTLSKNITHSIYNRGKVNVDKLKECITQVTFDF